MKKSLITLTLASFMVAGFQTATFAEDATPGKPCDAKKQEHCVNFAQKLNLTEAQSQTIKEMREKARTQIKPVIEELRAEKQKYREMVKNNASKADLETQKQKILKLKEKSQEIRKENLANFEKVLTPEQKTQFSEMKKAKMEKMKEQRAKHKKHMKEKFNQE
ncbi:MAG: hypothetical protein ACD_20C00210G0004 [uncultured bacterium]|nr:MAG: hypothetical protein ACD_20C00210G0004 [uncultured bacterium]HBH19212.1 hypothetical protein [Cyanobacteria bacterium UBA9579]